MNKIAVSAPGKLMLLGEHAVVYNHPCLVTAVDQRIRATVEFINKPIFELHAPDVQVKNYKKPMREIGLGEIPKGARFVEMAVKNTLELNSKFFLTVGIRVATKCEFFPKLGFGSSSASIVCIVKAISKLLGLNLTNKEIFDLSYKTVLDIQKKGSGFDVAAGVYGGTLYFLTGGKAIESLEIRSLPLVVGYSGVKTDTVQLINKVKKAFSDRKNRLNKIYNGIEVLVNQAKDALIKMDWEMLGDLMNKNQDYLRELGVSVDKIDNIISAALGAGAYGAKISGAGGGDCMIAVVSKDKEQVIKDSISQAGGKVVDIKANAEGVRME